MRKVTEQTVKAFLNRRSLTVGNTSTNGDQLFLHGNMIACHGVTGILVNFCGWPTRVTKERINGLSQLVNGQRPFFTRMGVLMAKHPKHGNVAVGDNEWLKLEIENVD